PGCRYRRRRSAGTGAAVAQEERGGLPARAGANGSIRRPRWSERSRLRRVVDHVDPLVRLVELVCRRAHLRVAAEERVSRRAVGVEVAAVTREPAGGVALLLA